MGHSRRITESILILFASLILLVGFALVFAAKLHQLIEDERVNINTADANTLPKVLGIDHNLAKLICEHRKKYGNFKDVDSLSQIRLLTKDEAERLASLNAQGKIDLSSISPRELSARTGIGLELAVRILESIAQSDSMRSTTASALSRIPLVHSDILASRKKVLKVRNASNVIISFWIKAFLIISVFFIFHLVLKKEHQMLILIFYPA